VINQLRRFEVFVLRPLNVLTGVAAVVLLVEHRWVLGALCVAGSFYVGLVGASLHPLQSARQLARGSIDTPAATLEAELLPSEVKNQLVDRACTWVGLFLGLATAGLLYAGLSWRWYAVFPVAAFCVMVSGACLKLIFQTLHNQTA
jgi:MFS family permease